jgi:hypothetical protein
VISVKTFWVSDSIVERAADLSAVIIAGPGKIWALVRWAQVAIASGPRVYCD